MRCRLASLLLLGTALGLHAQTAGQNQPSTPTLQVQSQLVLVPTTVETGKDEVIYGLKASQFLTQDNGVRQDVRLEDTANDARPLSLVVVVQCSRSAEREFPKLRGMATMVSALVGEAPTDTAVVQFGTGEELLSGFTRDPAARDRALSRLAPATMTTATPSSMRSTTRTRCSIASIPQGVAPFCLSARHATMAARPSHKT